MIPIGRVQMHILGGCSGRCKGSVRYLWRRQEGGWGELVIFF